MRFFLYTYSYCVDSLCPSVCIHSFWPLLIYLSSHEFLDIDETASYDLILSRDLDEESTDPYHILIDGADLLTTNLRTYCHHARPNLAS